MGRGLLAVGGGRSALSGLAHVLLVFVGSAVVGGTSGAGRHSLDASTADVGEFLADADVTRVWIGEWLAVLGYLLFLLFAPIVWRAAAHRGEDEASGRSATALAATFVGLSLAGTAALAPALNRPESVEGAALLLDLRTALFLIAFMALGAWLLVVGARGVRARSLPVWLSAAAIVIGTLHLALAPLATVDLGFTGVPTFAGFLWVAVASVLLARRPAAPV